MKNILWISILFISLSACSITAKKEKKITGNDYAEKFSIKNFNEFTIIEIFDPWQRSSGEKLLYTLAKDPENLPDSLNEYPVIKIPVSNVVVFSTTHIGFLKALNEEEGIKGVSGLKYVCNNIVRERRENNKVFEVGYPPAVDYERLIALSPDVVFLYGIESSVTGISSRLRQAGIPVFIVAEYLEPHPLGKTEWIRVFGHFYGKDKLADDFFQNVKYEYEKLQSIIDSIQKKPSVLVGLPWKNTWHLAGGSSYTSKLITDAGGNYLWKENNSMENIPSSLEAVLTKAMGADVWINPGSASSLSEIEGVDSRFSFFNAFKQGNIYNNDALICRNGGNPYWETGVVEPHLILKDLMKIFHSDILPDHDFAYYRKLE